MSKNTSEVLIKASAEEVWSALTNPELVKQWQYGAEVVTDWAIGSEIRFSTSWEGTTYEQWGRVMAFKPYELISYSLFAPRPGLADVPENYFMMSYILSENAGQTTLSVVQEDNRPQAPTASKSEDDSGVLNTLKSLVEAI